MSPFSASAATNVASSTATSSASTITALQSLITQLESEFAALVAAKETSATPAGGPTPTRVAFTRILSLGSTGADVSALQQILKSAGFYTYPTITGYFGPLTEKALASFQTAHGLDAVGYAGPKTRALLNGIASVAGSAVQPATPSSGGSSPASTATPSFPPQSPLFPITPGYGGGGVVATPPTINGTPSNSTAAATSPAGATVTYAAPTATDAVGGTAAVSCSPASGSTFALGVTTVTCTATDRFGNASHSSFSVTVHDTTAPSVSIPAPSNGATVSGSSVTLTATASDTIVAVANVQFEVDGTDIGA
ncbi:MAG: peptidoglycan-binding protein, partial [Roseiarcus sp.]